MKSLLGTEQEMFGLTRNVCVCRLPKTTSGQKLDCRFHLMRIGMFWGDIPMVESHVKVCQEVVDKGGDWERRNRLKVYEATYLLSIRSFKKAATLLLESISTFTATELYSYKQFVFYTVVCATVALDRKTIRDKVINAPEILQVVDEAPALEKMMTSLYKCSYRDFFSSLVDVVEQLHLDPHLVPHARYFLRQVSCVCMCVFFHLRAYPSISLSVSPLVSPSVSLCVSIHVRVLMRRWPVPRMLTLAIYGYMS